MAKGNYIGVNSVARKGKKMYIGVGGVARKVKKAYIGVNGVAKSFWSGTNPFYVIYDDAGSGKLYSGDAIDSLGEMASFRYGSSSGMAESLISGDYLFTVGSSKLFRISLANGTVEELNPISKLIANSVSTYFNYYDIKKVGNTLVAVVCDDNSASSNNGAYVVYSTDNGNSWKYTRITDSYTSTAKIVYVNGVYYVLRFSARQIWYSTDLVKWTMSSGSLLSSSYTVQGFCLFDNRVVVVSTYNSKVYLNYSNENPTGSPTFTQKTVGSSSYTMNPPVVENGIIFIPTKSTKVFYSTDLSSFSEMTLPSSANAMYDVIYKDNQYIIGTESGICKGANLSSLVLSGAITDVKRILVQEG